MQQHCQLICAVFRLNYLRIRRWTANSIQTCHKLLEVWIICICTRSNGHLKQLNPRGMGLIRVTWVIRLAMADQRPVIPRQKFWCKPKTIRVHRSQPDPYPVLIRCIHPHQRAWCLAVYNLPCTCEWIPDLAQVLHIHIPIRNRCNANAARRLVEVCDAQLS